MWIEVCGCTYIGVYVTLGYFIAKAKILKVILIVLKDCLEERAP